VAQPVAQCRGKGAQVVHALEIALVTVDAGLVWILSIDLDGEVRGDRVSMVSKPVGPVVTRDDSSAT